MKNVLVSTQNLQRFWGAARALEARLENDEVVGLGLVYGSPGLGKTMAMEAYNARTNGDGRYMAVLVRALAIWTETSMLKDLLGACGKTAKSYRKDVFYDDLKDTLRGRPVIFLIDQIDAVADRRSMVSILHDIHDQTGSVILMVGEERVDGILRRHQAFYSRINTSALVRMEDPTESDVRAVVEQRCDFPVAPEVSTEIYRSVGRSMRLVVDMIRSLEAVARANELRSIGMSELRKVFASKRMGVVGNAAAGGRGEGVSTSLAAAAGGGFHG